MKANHRAFIDTAAKALRESAAGHEHPNSVTLFDTGKGSGELRCTDCGERVAWWEVKEVHDA
jgi:hypothetical protein